MTNREFRAAREKLGITQKQLARKLYLSENTIARYEMPSNNNGRYPIPHWVVQWMRVWVAMEGL